MANNNPRGLIQGAAFASGKRASFQCPVCADVVPYQAAVKRWDNQWVCASCKDPKHPAETRRSFKDAIALHHPRVDNAKGAVDVGFGLFAITYDEAGAFNVVVS